MRTTDRERASADEPRIWFAPKAFGFGFVPVAWSGWLLTIGYVAVVLAIDTALPPGHRDVEIALIVILSAGFFAVAAHHTRGGLRWRWGDEQ